MLVRESIQFKRSEDPYKALGIGQENLIRKYFKKYNSIGDEDEILFNLPEEILKYFYVKKRLHLTWQSDVYIFLENGNFPKIIISKIYNSINYPSFYSFYIETGEIFLRNERIGMKKDLSYESSKFNKGNPIDNLEKASEFILNDYLKKRKKLK